MDFEKAAALATLWVELVCEGQARIVRELTIAKPYGWIFFYESKLFLDSADDSKMLIGNAPIIVDRDTLTFSWGYGAAAGAPPCRVRENALSSRPSTDAATSNLVIETTAIASVRRMSASGPSAK
jgi:hypothetical protein